MSTLLESIARDLRDLPAPRLIDVSTYIHSLGPPALDAERRRDALRSTAGCMAGEEGAAFERAVRETSDRIDRHE